VRESGVIGHLQSGQNLASAASTAPQCGHFAEVFTGFTGSSSGILSGLFGGLDNSASIRLLSAFFANTINLESMASGDVLVSAPDFLFKLSDFLGKEFDRSLALGTHHVVMTAPVVLVFIARDAIVESYFASQTATGQKLQRPIDGSETDARIGFLNQSMEFVNRKMFASFKKCPENCAALFGLLQADAFKMLMKNTFSFADVLPRDSQLIVDSLLQHVGGRTHPMIMHAKGSNMILGESR
jgi:hypothetical protein